MKNLSLKHKLLFAFCAIGLVSLVTIGYKGYSNGRASLETAAFNQLNSVRATKARTIESYFTQIRSQVQTLSEDRMIIDAMREFKSAFHSVEHEIQPTADELAKFAEVNRGYYQNEFLPRLNANVQTQQSLTKYWPDTKNTIILQHQYLAGNPNPTGEKDSLMTCDDDTIYSDVHAKYHPIVRNFLKKFGYYDIFLIDDQTGHIVYSVFKEVDYATSLLTGPYKDTNFADAFRAASNASEGEFTRLVDFAQYDPSYAAPASFIASPIFDGDEKLGVLIFQMPVDEINRVMTGDENWSTEGLGASGETYLIGDDYRMRSISRFLVEDAEGYFAALKAGGAEPSTIDRIRSVGTSLLLQKVETDAAKAALSGKTGQEIVADYRGIPVLSAYSPLNIDDVNWCILSEIDEAEAFAPVAALARQNVITGLIILALICVAALYMTKSLAVPINNLTQITEKMAAGNMNQSLQVQSKDEVGRMASALNNTLDELNSILGTVHHAAERVATGADQVNASSQAISQGATEQAASLEEITASMTDIANQTKQNADHARQASELTETATQDAAKGNEMMQEMVGAMDKINVSSQEISKIIKVIDEIAFQTNLLALNAAVEAARAGAHGKGFAVVAEEVRNLAARSANAARETTELIEGSIKCVSEGNSIANSTASALTEIVDGISKASTLVEEIANLSNEQATGLNQIKEGLVQLDSVTQQSSANSERSADVVSQLNDESEHLLRTLEKFELRPTTKEKPSHSFEDSFIMTDEQHILDAANKSNGNVERERVTSMWS